MNHLLRDLRYAWRRLLANPGLTAIAVLSLALGIGANTTIFSFVNAVFLRPLSVEKPSELVSMYTDDTSFVGHLLPVSYLNYVDYRASDVFKGLAAEVRLQLNLGAGAGTPERVAAASVTANYFDVLGVKPLLGRTFTKDEDAPVDAHPVIVLSSNFWRQRFGADPGMVGKTILVNGLKYTVIGIAKEGFRGPTLLANYDAWVPMTQRKGIVGFLERWFDARQASMAAVYGRLRSADGLERAKAATATVSERLAREYPMENHTRKVVLIPFAEATLNPNQRGQVLRMSWFLTIMVALVLALACTNVANLLLSRALARQREVAVRIAIGAGRGRLVRQLLTESLLLAVLGGAAGMLLAVWGRSLLWSFKPPTVPDTLDVPFDPRVLLFTLGLTLLTGLLFGLIPALQTSRPNLVVALKSGGSAEPGKHRFSGRNALVIGQIALSLLLLVGTGLVLRSLAQAQHIDPGFAADHLITLNMDPDGVGYDHDRAVALFHRVIEKVEAVPGVKSAAWSFNRPLTGAISALFYLEGKNVPSPKEGAPVGTNAADAKFFETVGIELKQGRNFNDSDTDKSTPSIIINQALADRFFDKNESPVGHIMRFVDVPTPWLIVGVATDAKYGSLGEQTPNYYYYPFYQAYGAGEVTLFIRTKSAPAPLISAVRREVQALDPNLPLYNVAVVSDLVTQSLWAQRAAAALLVFFGILGLVLATVGTYGVMSYQVDQTRREIGIRMALGELRSKILGRVIGRGMILVGAGLVVGIGVALITTRLIATFLYGLSATDLVTFVVTPLVLALAAFGATLVPARRATAVDPLRVLRSE